MRNELIFIAIGELSDKFIADAEINISNHKPKAYPFRWKTLVAACLVLIMLALPVHAEMVNGYVSNLLAPLYGSSQTEIVEKIGKPIGASTVVGDYKLTADAIIGDRYSVAVIYSLTRTDGLPLEEGLGFQTYSNSVKTNGGASYSQVLSDDKMVLKIVEKWYAKKELLINRNINIVFTNLVRNTGSDKDPQIIQNGNWNLKFCLRYEDTTTCIETESFTVTDSSRISYQIENIFISPVGIHIDMSVPNPHAYGIDASRHFEDFCVALLLNTGERIDIKNRNFGYNGDLDEEYLVADYTALFVTPLDLADIDEIIICDTFVPITGEALTK